MKDAISVVIPTTASARRAPLLGRALRSLQSTSGGEVLPIVVVNGDRYVPSILEALKRRRDIRCLYLEVGDHVEARRVGRCAVDTEFFGLLDDDDEYLSGTLQVRLEPLRRDSSLDVVITNGYRHHAGQDALQFPQLAAFQTDPLGSLMDYAWLHGAGAAFRTETVPESYFAGPRCMELTYLAMKLALTKRLRFVEEPTYRWHRGTAESLWETSAYQLRAPDAIRQMRALNPPTRIKRKLARKYAASLHSLSESARQRGDYRAAWRFHLRCLVVPFGARYLSYTRHLLRFGYRSVRGLTLW